MREGDPHFGRIDIRASRHAARTALRVPVTVQMQVQISGGVAQGVIGAKDVRIGNMSIGTSPPTRPPRDEG